MKMKRYVVGLMLAVSSLTLLADALARPLGGGRSFGRQSQNVTRQVPAPAPAAPRQAATPAPAPAPMPQQARAPSRWKGILGGALLGLGLGALLSHFGLGGALASMISSLLMLVVLALIVLFIFRLVRGKDARNAAATPFPGPAGRDPLPSAAIGGTPDIGSRLQPSAFQPQASAFQPAPAAPLSLDKPAPSFTPWGLPPGFDTEGFLRQAKTNFIRLQAAWDKSDVEDLREFTSTEVFAELKMQIQERGGNADFTDVVNVEATLLGIETAADTYLASVQFDALIRSAPQATPEPFAEVWNMSKPVSGTGGWVLAGIQQMPDPV